MLKLKLKQKFSDMKSENRLLLFLFALAAPQTAFGQNGLVKIARKP